MPRVLHIEDDPANRLLVRKILSKAGFEVIDALDGLEGLRLAREHSPDLVLVDLNIPGLDGYEVTLRLRGEEVLQHVPIVAITAEGDRSTSLAVGCDGFVQKPIHARSFADTIAGFLDGRRERAPARSHDHLRAQSQRIVARLEAKIDELSAANRDLHEAQRVRAAFYRNISHELATPMTPIVGYVRLLAEQELGPLNPAQRKAVNAMDGCVERLRTLIDNLLDITGLEAGTMRFAHTDFDVGQVLRRVIERHQQPCRDKSIQLVVDAPQRPMPAWGDPARFGRGVAQLLDNAVKFTPEGGAIGVRLQHRQAAYELWVADTGPGIAPEQIEKAVEPFYQVDGSPTRVHGGVGVGLAIARRVAEGLGGGLELRSPANLRIGRVTFRGLGCVMSLAERAPSPAQAP